MNASRLLPYFKGVAMIGSLVALGYLFHILDLGSLLSTAWMDSAVRGQGISGEALFIGVGALATAVGLPRQIVSFLAGYGFGLALGGLFGLLATTLGCLLAFYYARLVARDMVSKRFSQRVRRIDAYLQGQPFLLTLLIRLLPVGSNVATNVAAGLSAVPAMPFFTGSTLGFIPQTLVFALIGSGVTIAPLYRTGLGTVLFVVSGMLGVYLYNKFRHGHSLYNEVEDSGDVA